MSLIASHTETESKQSTIIVLMILSQKLDQLLTVSSV